MNLTDIFSAGTEVFNLLLDQFTTTVTTITSNAILFVPVLCALGGGIMLAAVKLVRKLGVKGVGGRRRRR